MTNFKVSPKVAAFAVTIFFIASFWGASVAKADIPHIYCNPPGVEKSFTFQIDSCLWHVKICFNCSYVTHPLTEITIMAMWPDPTCDSMAYKKFPQAEAYIRTQLEYPPFIYNNICFWPPIAPPCGTSVLEVKEKWANCYYAECVLNDWQTPITVFRPCNEPPSNYCIETIEWCWNGTTYERHTASLTGESPNCRLTINDVIIPKLPSEPKSDCFSVPNNCFPIE